MNVAWSRATAGLVVTFSMSLLVGCKAEVPAAAPTPPPVVTVSQPVTKEITDFLEFTGRAESPDVVEIRARVSGYLHQINFVDGQEVKANEPLFEIDLRPFVATLGQANAEFARTTAVLAKATADAARSKTLRESKTISQEELEQAIADQAVAEASAASAKEAIVKAELDIEFAKIKAPIAGRVSRANISVGNLISPGDGASSVLTTIVSVDPMEVNFDVDEQSFLRYKELLRKNGKLLTLAHVKDLKLPVHVSVGDKDGFVHQGELDFVDNQVNPATGTIRARALLNNKDRTFVTGQFVRVRLTYGDPHKVMLVPDRAIGTDQGLRYVLVVNEKHQVERHDVTLGSLSNGERVIESGLKPDDWVIVNGIQRARPGAEVKTQQK